MSISSRDKFAPMKLVKRALSIYMNSKHQIDKRHQFAVVLLQENAIWASFYFILSDTCISLQ